MHEFEDTPFDAMSIIDAHRRTMMSRQRIVGNSRAGTLAPDGSPKQRFEGLSSMAACCQSRHRFIFPGLRRAGLTSGTSNDFRSCGSTIMSRSHSKELGSDDPHPPVKRSLARARLTVAERRRCQNVVAAHQSPLISLRRVVLVHSVHAISGNAPTHPARCCITAFYPSS